MVGTGVGVIVGVGVKVGIAKVNVGVEVGGGSVELGAATCWEQAEKNKKNKKMEMDNCRFFI